MYRVFVFWDWLTEIAIYIFVPNSSREASRTTTTVVVVGFGKHHQTTMGMKASSLVAMEVFAALAVDVFVDTAATSFCRVVLFVCAVCVGFWIDLMQ
jgi:hypothetical protein